MKAWLKGGIILVLIGLVDLLLTYMLSGVVPDTLGKIWGGINVILFGLAYRIAFYTQFIPDYTFFIFIPALLLTLFVEGALIGWIVGLIKSKLGGKN